MEVKIVPGPRHEELISLIKKVKDTNTDEAWEILEEYEGTEEYLDALFYACECGEEMLREQTEYFHWLLLNEEDEYYIDRMLPSLLPRLRRVGWNATSMIVAPVDLICR